MYEHALTQTGLTTEQAVIYEILIKNGELPARAIFEKSHYSRPLVYKVLDELSALGLVEKSDKPGKVATFSLTHPVHLKEVVDKKFEHVKAGKAALDSVLGQITSEFNLTSGKPGVEFYEGISGVQTVLEDSLSAQTEIYSYADIESVEKRISEANKEYVKAREDLGIKKKGIVFDTPFARTFLKDYAPSVTETKLITYEAKPSHAVMQIYDGKISYITLSEDNLIGVIVTDERIFSLHRDLFLYLWNITPEIALHSSQTRKQSDHP